jgi:hypothetical protein
MSNGVIIGLVAVFVAGLLALGGWLFISWLLEEEDLD